MPKDFRRYVEFISRTKNAEAAALLISVLHEMVMNLYVESGLFKPLNEGTARFEITGVATNGAAVAKAFEIAGAIGAIARTFKESGVFEDAQRSADTIADVIGRQAYYAGGFDAARWGSGISGYFEDAGGDLYRRLGEVRGLLAGGQRQANR